MSLKFDVCGVWDDVGGVKTQEYRACNPFLSLQYHTETSATTLLCMGAFNLSVTLILRLSEKDFHTLIMVLWGLISVAVLIIDPLILM